MAAPFIDLYTPETGRRTRVVRDADTGLPLIVNDQHVTPIVDDCKRAASMVDRHEQRRRRTRGAGIVQVAEIPFVIWNQLQRLGIAQDQQALMKWLSRRDSRAFRVDDGRPLA